MAGSLEGRVIAIAGGAGNLGPTVVRRLAEAGAVLSVAGRDRSALEALRADVGESVEPFAVDLLDPEATRGWATALRRNTGTSTVSSTSSAAGVEAPIEDAPLEDWDFLSGLLVRTLQHATQAFAPSLLESGHGRFALVSAGQAQAPTHPNAAYAAAKAASETWTLALADRFRGAGATAGTSSSSGRSSLRDAGREPRQGLLDLHPAEEIAEAIAHLCSDAAASMNSQRLALRGAA